MLPDPHQHDYGRMWLSLLDQSPEAIARALLEDSDQGALLRQTRPVFGRGLTSQDVVRLLESADVAEG